MSFSYNLGEIFFILMSIYCVYCTYRHMDNPESELREREASISKFKISNTIKVMYFLIIHTVTIMWGLSFSKSDLSFYSYLGSQILNALIIHEMIYKELPPRSKHYYLAEIWSTLSWLLIACEIFVKQSLY